MGFVRAGFEFEPGERTICRTNLKYIEDHYPDEVIESHQLEQR